MTSGARMLLQYCEVGVTMSWEEAHLGARASRPHNSSRSLGHLLDPGRPARTPRLCFGRAHVVPPRQGGRLRHRRETERQAKGEDAGGTPALPGGGLLPSSVPLKGGVLGCQAAALLMRQSRHAWWPFVVLRVTSWITLLF